MQFGITAIIGLQAMINIGVVTSSIPNTGMQLPFFSYGGTALLILLSAVRYTAEHIETGQEDLGCDNGDGEVCRKINILYYYFK